MDARAQSRIPADSIPVIDFSGAFSRDPRRRERVAHALFRAGASTGFFYLRGHGIERDLVARVFANATRFFALSQGEKAALHLRHSTCRRGYENIGDQTLDPAARPDLKESFYCGVDYAPTHPFVRAGYDSYGASQWPPSLPGFRADMQAYIAAQRRLCEKIMQMAALALGLDEHFFDGTFHEPMVTLRLLRYPPHPADASPGMFGAGAHTDWGAVTTLAQDDLGGLEVRLPDGASVSAPPLCDTFVVNFGDMMPRWTNGRFRSNLHRVVNRNASGRDRYSIPFFYAPRYTARIEPVPTCLAPDGSAAFAACTAGEHIAEMVALTYGRNRTVAPSP